MRFLPDIHGFITNAYHAPFFFFVLIFRISDITFVTPQLSLDDLQPASQGSSEHLYCIHQHFLDIPA